MFRKSPLTSQAIPIVQPSNAPSDTWFPLRFSMEINAADELKIQTIKVEPETESLAAASTASTTTTPEDLSTDTAASTSPLSETKSLKDSLPTTAATALSAPKSKKRTYNLSSVVCQITEGNQTHLVALIHVTDVYHRMKPEPVRSRPGQWYVFNDFNINPIQLDEAPWYTLEWKVPCVLFYTSTDMPAESSDVQRDTLVNPFVQDYFTQPAAKKRYDLTFKPLTSNEMPKAGDFVAMDAEFVTLNPEENEISSDGKTTTIKPCHMSVARITCIRG